MDADLEPPVVTFVLHFISDVSESIWIADGAPELTERHWVSVHGDGRSIAIAPSCECPCDDCPCVLDCEPTCRSVSEIEHSGSAEYGWDGVEWIVEDCPDAPAGRCLRFGEAPPGTYTARFCWGYSLTGGTSCATELQNVQCQDVEFELPEPDGVVEYTVNFSG